MMLYRDKQSAERRSTLPRSTFDWTEERTAALKELWANGRSAGEIARSLGGGVTRSAVIGKVHRLKLLGHGRNDPKPPKPKRSHKADQGSGGTRAHRNKGQTSGPVIAARIESRASYEPEPIPDDLPDVTDRIGVMELRTGMCKWPSGDPLTPEFSFCGEPVEAEGKPYCAHHASRAYIRP